MTKTRDPVDVFVLGADVEMRDLLEMIFELAEDFRLLAVDEPDTAMRLFRELRPSVVVLDLEPVDQTAGARVRQVREASPSSRVIALSGFPDPLTLLDVLRNGASSYIDKATAWRDLLPAIRSVCREPLAG